MYSDFDWATAPLNSRTVPITAGVAYLITLFILPKIVPKGGLPGMDMLLVLHNGILSAWSAIMFLGCLRELIVQAQAQQSVDFMFCETAANSKGPLYFWSYIFYISKFYEMVDTILAHLKGSPPPFYFLHVYHHSLVPLMIWHWLEHQATLQFPGLLFNCFVHIVMYAYYALKVLKVPTPWKNWITRLQIIQFVTSVVLLVVSWMYYLDGQPLNPKCKGMTTLWINIAFNMTFLWQFTGVLLKNTGKKKKLENDANGKKD